MMYDIQKDDRTPLTKKVFDYIGGIDEMLDAIRRGYDSGLFDKDNSDPKIIKKIIRGKIDFSKTMDNLDEIEDDEDNDNDDNDDYED